MLAMHNNIVLFLKTIRMASFLLLFAAVFSQYMVCKCMSEPVVAIYPESFNASEGSVVTFNCTLSGFSSTPATTFAQLVGSNGILSDSDKTARRITTQNSQTNVVVTIEATTENNNLAITCGSAVDLTSSPILSPTAVFLVQGSLSPPEDLSIAASSSSPSSSTLSWTPPFSLDITDVEPDITGYNVCFNISATPSCVRTEETSYEFLNLRSPLEFVVSAINVVGEGLPATILYPGCDQSTVPADIGLDLVSVQVSMTRGVHSFTVTIEQPPDTTCYDIYTLRLTAVPSGDLRVVGPLLPVVVAQPFVQILEIDGPQDLDGNQIFSVDIVNGNNNEQMAFDNLMFSTHDVQQVSLRPVASGALTLSCSFLTGSDARGCALELSRAEGENMTFVMAVDLELSSPAVDVVVDVAGLYVVTAVADIENDGNRTSIGDLSFLGPLQANVNLATPNLGVTVTTVASGNILPEAGGDAGVVIGIVVAVVAVILVVVILTVIILTVIILLAHWKKITSKISMDLEPPAVPPKKRQQHSGSYSPTVQEGSLEAQHFTASPPTAITSKESLISVDPNLTYAQLEPRPAKSGKPRENDAVVYSEICVDQIPPVLPKKKRMMSADTSLAHSLSTV